MSTNAILIRPFLGLSWAELEAERAYYQAELMGPCSPDYASDCADDLAQVTAEMCHRLTPPVELRGT